MTRGNTSVYCCRTYNVYSPVESKYKEWFFLLQLILWNAKYAFVFSDWQAQFWIYILTNETEIAIHESITVVQLSIL